MITKKDVFIVLLIWIVVYILIAFVKTQINFILWSEKVRFFLVIVNLFFAYLIFSYKIMGVNK